MARIPESEIERVKRQTDLLALVRSRGIELKPHGSKNWRGLCPFHNDQETPNFIVTPGNGLWHCMACGKAGNAIQFVERHDGLSFRHAFELLTQGNGAAYKARPPAKQSTVPHLPCPLDAAADDAALFAQVVAYYHQRFKETSEAQAYLASRGLDYTEKLAHFQIGFADRTLGLRLPFKNRQDGERLRSRLIQLGVWRKSGHEHFNGCVVVPLRDETGATVSLYGRRLITQDGFTHLYPPGPHRGLFNPAALGWPEIILCEAPLDALTFCCHGFPNTTCIFGAEGFTDELWEAVLRHKVQRVRLAYDADEAGERAAKRDAVRLRGQGIEVYRVKFPWGMDANEYARKVTPPDKSLALLVNSAVWVGNGQAPPSPPPKTQPTSSVVPEHAPAPAPSSLVAAFVSSLPGTSAKEEKAAETQTTPAPQTESVAPPVVSSPTAAAASPSLALEPRGDAWFMELEGREYRVMGLEKANGAESLKITLRLKLGERFHLDQVDLCRDAERRRFIERAAEETGLAAELLKRDLSRLLLATEQAQTELAQPQETVAPSVTLTPEEHAEAMAWLTAPDLIGRLRQAFGLAGLIGEENNALVTYLACVSRKLERPLAIIIQSASASGKTMLMDSVLSFFPEEERVKYSAMTGQSLYYLGETSLKHKILAIVEEAGAEKASYALKLLQSEGELVIASTGKDPQSGKMVTHEYRLEGPVCIILTTTAIELDEELLNRCLVLTVDESPEQTRRIHEAQRERRTYAGLVAREERRDILRKLRNAQRLLQPLEVINPYATLLDFPSDRTRTRRDNEKYLTLMDANALLHQHQRPRSRKEVAGGRVVECVEVTLEDIALANQLAPEALARNLDELPPQTRGMLKIIRKMAMEKPGARPFLFSRRALCETSGWSLTQVRAHLERLVEHEYLAVRQGRFGSQFLYELLIEADALETVTHIKLIDVEELRKKYIYNDQPGGFLGGVAGGGKTTPPGCLPSLSPSVSGDEKAA